MPIRKYLVSGHHHIIVTDYDEKQYVSVGLTSDDPKNKRNQELHKVYESNGKIARLKRNAVIDKKNRYHKRLSNFNVDIETEKKAYLLAMNKKTKKRNTN